MKKAGEEGVFYQQHLIFPTLLRALGDVSGLSVVDLGCASGTSSRLLARADVTVMGVDVSTAMVERARRRERTRPLGFDYSIADATHMPAVADAQFDQATASMVLHDLDDTSRPFYEVYRLLKPGGRFVATLLHPCFWIEGGSSWLIEQREFEPRRSHGGFGCTGSTLAT